MTRTHILALALLLTAVGPAAGQTTVTFEDLSLAAQSFDNGASRGPSGGPFSSGGATFNNTYTNFGGGFETWAGWSYSNMVDTSTAGFGNQYAAFTGGGAGGSANYGVAFQSFDFSPPFASVFTPTITLPAGQRPQSAQITNTTYAALSMRDGDSFAKKFGGASGNDADYFRLTITGRNASGQSTGTVEFFLADYRFTNNAQDFIVDQWTTVDLSALGVDTTSLSFDLDSSDNGSFGMNTPAYFAFDNLVLVPVPEPMTVGLLVTGGLLTTRMARRRLR